MRIHNFRPNTHYTETYSVKYKILFNGLEQDEERIYYATIKNAHTKVEKVFKRDYPKAYSIRVIYQ